MTNRKTLGIGTLLLLIAAIRPLPTAAQGDCTLLGRAGGRGQAIPLDRLLADIDVLDGRWAITEGVLSVEPGGSRLCLGKKGETGSDLARDCLHLGFAWERLGGDERSVTRFLEQWYQRRVRVRGRVYAEGGLYFNVVQIYRGGLYNITTVELLEPSPDRWYCLDELDAMPPPASPNEYLGGRREHLIRCSHHEEDGEGLVVCLDFEKPWVWTETHDAWVRTEYLLEPPEVGAFLSSIKYLIALGNGSFAAIQVERVMPGELVGDVIVWNGEQFVDVAQDAVYDLFPDGGRFFFAEVDREDGRIARSRIYSVNSTGRKSLISVLEGQEVLSVTGYANSVEVSIREEDREGTIEVPIPRAEEAARPREGRRTSSP